MDDRYVIGKVIQRGRLLSIENDSLRDFQHSANLYLELDIDSDAGNPFAGTTLSAPCRSRDDTVVCPVMLQDDGKHYILLREEVFKNAGEVGLSIGGISEDKIVVTSNMIKMTISDSGPIKAEGTPPETYWEIEVLNAMKAWYSEVVDPTFDASNEKLNQLIRRTEEHEEKAEELQQKVQEQQNQVANAIGDAEQATQTANTAAANADEKAVAATTAAQAANKAKSDADTAAGKANKAASDANAAASNANTKAGEAAAAAAEANTARDSANTLTQTVQQKLANGDFNGRTMHNGIGDPPVVLGKDGDTYLNKSHEGQYPKWLYLKEGGKWIPLWKTDGDDGTDTVPVGAGYLISGDTVPPGYKETTPPFSNPNLLINGDFQVWQWGDTFNTNLRYTADRWIVSANTVSVYKNPNGLAVNAPNDSDGIAIMQYVEKKLNSKTMTMSFEYSTDTGSVKVAKTITVSNQIVKYKINDNCSVALHFDESIGCTCYVIILKNISTVLKWCKLEYGKIATPLAPRLFAEESMLCQRYFQPFDVVTPIMYEYGDDSNGYAYLIEPRFAKMRATPSIASDIHFNYYDGAGNNVSGICVSAQAYNGYLTARTTAGGARLQNHCFGVKIATTLDAEIYKEENMVKVYAKTKELKV